MLAPSGEFPIISNFGFVFEARTEDNLEPNKNNADFIPLLEQFIIDAKNSNDKV